MSRPRAITLLTAVALSMLIQSANGAGPLPLQQGPAVPAIRDLPSPHPQSPLPTTRQPVQIFLPRTVRTSEMTLTGLRAIPRTVRTGEMTLTGHRQ